MEDNLQQIRHSLAHLLAASVKTLWPNAKNAIGPAIENGFYQDFDMGEVQVSQEDFKAIEKQMRQLLKKWHAFEVKEVSVEQAKKDFADNPYKLELIEDFAKEGKTITENDPGNFLDLCRGGHSENPQKELQHFKLLSVAGAYWRGNEKNKMLTRIYGTAFATEKELDDYLTMQEEAKKRDHRVLGKKMDLFVFSDLVGPGLPMYTFKGTAILESLKKYINELQQGIGYQEVMTPSMNRAELFKVSGHYEKYKDDMFTVHSHYTDEEYFLKPMNCPQHTQIYASKPRSYRDLPIRIADFSQLHRDEKTGELSGLTRLRGFRQDDGHAFCREDQIKDEFKAVLSVVEKAMKTFGMNYKIRFSMWDPKHPEKYLGDAATWEKSQKLLEEILIESKIEYIKAEGEAAIYGPKMDLISKDSLGREWQLSTIQVDFIMPQRFGLTYTDSDGKDKTPVMVHRAIAGCPERFLGILIEHYSGNFPVWLAPVQMAIIPISSEKHLDYANEVAKKMQALGFRFEIMKENDSLGKKIRTAEMQHIPYLLIIGDKEMEAGAVGVRQRGKGDLGAMPIDEFIEKVTAEIISKQS